MINFTSSPKIKTQNLPPRNWISSPILQFRTFFCHSDKMFSWTNILFKVQSRNKVLFNHISDWFTWSSYHVWTMFPGIGVSNTNQECINTYMDELILGWSISFPYNLVHLNKIHKIFIKYVSLSHFCPLLDTLVCSNLLIQFCKLYKIISIIFQVSKFEFPKI